MPPKKRKRTGRGGGGASSSSTSTTVAAASPTGPTLLGLPSELLKMITDRVETTAAGAMTLREVDRRFAERLRGRVEYLTFIAIIEERQAARAAKIALMKDPVDKEFGVLVNKDVTNLEINLKCFYFTSISYLYKQVTTRRMHQIAAKAGVQALRKMKCRLDD